MIDEEINRLHFENIVWVIFAILAFLNIVGDNDSINFLKTNNPKYKNESDTIFKITLFCTFLIYLYFFNRNIKAYKKVSQSKKELYKVKVYGSLFLIIGILLLIYFQNKETSFLDSPAI